MHDFGPWAIALRMAVLHVRSAVLRGSADVCLTLLYVVSPPQCLGDLLEDTDHVFRGHSFDISTYSKHQAFERFLK